MQIQFLNKFVHEILYLTQLWTPVYIYSGCGFNLAYWKANHLISLERERVFPYSGIIPQFILMISLDIILTGWRQHSICGRFKIEL